MFITKRHLSRRTVLKGMGVTVALPLLDAMVPAGTAHAPRRPPRARCGSSPSRWCTARPAAPPTARKKNLWSPAATGRELRSDARRALAPLEPLREHITIVSNTDLRMAEAFTTPEIGGDHFRASAVFLTQAHPEADDGLGRARRHLDRPALRAALRPGHADSVDAAVHRERRSGRRLRIRLLLRLHRLDQLGVADRAAADDSRSARGVRSAVRRRRHAGGARAAPPARTAASSTR